MSDARRVAVASGFAVLQRVLVRCIGLVSTLVLVRLLSPEDFGIVALAAVVHGTLESLTNLSFALALIRIREPSQAQYDTAFTLGLVRAGLIATTLVATAQLQAGFMGDSRIGPVMYVLGISVILQGCESIRMVDLQRALRFDTLMRYVLLHKLVHFSVALPFAIWAPNYWALVVAMPVGWLVMVPLSYRLAPYRPRITFGAWRELLTFSKWLVAGNLFHVVESQLMTVAVGRLSGISAAGFFQVAYQIAALPITELAAPLRGPAYVGFARTRDNLTELRRQVSASLALQMTLIAPMSIGIALTAREITLLFMGAQWIELVPLIQLIAVYALLDAPASFMHNVLIALGRPALYLTIYATVVTARVAAVIGGAFYAGAVGAAAGMLVVSVANLLLSVGAGAILIGLDSRALARTFGRGTVGVVSMAVAVDVATQLQGAAQIPSAHPVTTLLLKVMVGVVIYCCVILGSWMAVGRPRDSAEADVISAIRHALGRMGLANR
jgi:O-antigen/teichoic acid export membrane protein